MSTSTQDPGQVQPTEPASVDEAVELLAAAGAVEDVDAYEDDSVTLVFAPGA